MNGPIEEQLDQLVGDLPIKLASEGPPKPPIVLGPAEGSDMENELKERLGFGIGLRIAYSPQQSFGVSRMSVAVEAQAKAGETLRGSLCFLFQNRGELLGISAQLDPVRPFSGRVPGDRADPLLIGHQSRGVG